MTAEHPSTTGLDPNVAATLAYLAGPLSALPFLLIEKESALVRFHAWQSTIVFLMVGVLWTVLMQVPVVGWFVALVIAPPLLFVLWLVLMVKAYLGEKLVLPLAGTLAERLNTRLS